MRSRFRGRLVQSVCRYTDRKKPLRRRRLARPEFLTRLQRADRSSLLVSTALASTFLVGSLLGPTPLKAAALDACGSAVPGAVDTATCTATSGVGNPYPDGIAYDPVNNFRLIVQGDVVVDSDSHGVYIPYTADLTNFDVRVDTYAGAGITADLEGILVTANGDIVINNAAEIEAGVDGILAVTLGPNNGLALSNTGAIDADTGIFAEIVVNTVAGDNVSSLALTSDYTGPIHANIFGIHASTDVTAAGSANVSSIFLSSSANIGAGAGTGIFASTVVNTVVGDNVSSLLFSNTGDINADAGGIYASTSVTDAGAANHSTISLSNHGHITTNNNGIFAETVVTGVTGDNTSSLSAANTNDIDAANLSGISIDTIVTDASADNVSTVVLDSRGNIRAGADGLSARSVVDSIGGDSVSPIVVASEGSITAGAAGMFVQTSATNVTGANRSSMAVFNNGPIGANTDGIYAQTFVAGVGGDNQSSISFDSQGDIDAGGDGIFGQAIASGVAGDNNNSIGLLNSSHITAANIGIHAVTSGAAGGSNESSIFILHQGDIDAGDDGISASASGTAGANSASVIGIVSAGDIHAGLDGIYAASTGNAAGDNFSVVYVVNYGVIDADRFGIVASSDGTATLDNDASILIYNQNNVTSDQDAVYASASGTAGGENDSSVEIHNSGDIDSGLFGFFVLTHGDAGTNNDSSIDIESEGAITAGTNGFLAVSTGTAGGNNNSSINIVNSSNIDAGVAGMYISSLGDAGAANNSSISIENSGDITAVLTGIYANAFGTAGGDNDSSVSIQNSGDITSARDGIAAVSSGLAGGINSSSIDITNAGAINADRYGISADASGAGASVIINNEGSVYGGATGILIENSDASSAIINSAGASISAGYGPAIDVQGPASTNIVNYGTVTGFVHLTPADDVFINASGGLFEARETSDFGAGFDVFFNTGTVHTADDRKSAEFTSFVNLEEFDNAGLISMVDGRPGDIFLIDGPVAFNASSGSQLAVDAKLGPPGSKSDVLEIDGDVQGKTALLVNTTNPGGGAFNKQGIPVVEVTGSTTGKDFFLKNGPIENGLFVYDLVFDPGSPNIFELQSGTGAGAFVLPELLTAMQDLWHTTSASWSDRTADLRVMLYGGGRAPLQGASYLAPADPDAAASYQKPYPGLWARGSYAGLNRDNSVNTGFGTANLDRDQRVGDFEGGFDFGKRDLFAPGDALIVGVLGGFVVSQLDYDKLSRNFDLNGGEVGAYATYLNGGLLIDTLFKADFLTVDSSPGSGMPSSLDAHNLGVRLDSGYRFGDFAPGLFFEPLGTITVVDSEIDNFALAGNKIDFEDGTSVRGRLGLRAGTSFRMAEMTVEPFVIGSVWHEFEGTNQALLVSGGTLFNLLDSIEGTWGEVSAGVNLFNVGAGASGFGKVDVVFGDDIEGVGGQVGVRYKW